MDDYCPRTGPMYVKSVMDGPWHTKDKCLKLTVKWIKEARSDVTATVTSEFPLITTFKERLLQLGNVKCDRL